MEPSRCEIGMIGLGTMGSNLVLNMADKGFRVAAYDRSVHAVENLAREAGHGRVRTARTLDDFMAALRRPRHIMLLVPAGAIVDAVIQELKDHLQPDDLVIDGGNSFYKDTIVRARTLGNLDVHYLGVGISGGGEGARHGPSLMPGGPKQAYERVRPIFEAVAAKVDGEPCVAWLGPGAAGHYVKMVHNGIEYAFMQLIAEVYDLLDSGLDLKAEQLGDLFAEWNRGELNSFLVEITSRIMDYLDPQTHKPLVDLILDEARQLGTGKWTAQDAMDLQVPVPMIDVAVTMRDLSGNRQVRHTARRFLRGPAKSLSGERDRTIPVLRNALYFGMIAAYAQGMHLLWKASGNCRFQLRLEDVARIWRGGCIIRAALLEKIRQAYRRDGDLVNPILDPDIARELNERQDAMREAVRLTVDLGFPAPALASALAYFDAYRRERLPTNLIQAQRDYFGAHRYERVDAKGTFHTLWDQYQG